MLDPPLERSTPVLDSEDDSSALRRTLHQRGLRMTPQRQLVLDAVRQIGHATPEQICTEVQRVAPAVNITTVYRTLDLLERLDLVRHTHLGHGAPSYSEQEHQHVHVVCHACGTVSEAPTEMMDALVARLQDEMDFALDVAHVALSGQCRTCRDASSGDGAARNADTTDNAAADNAAADNAAADSAAADSVSPR